MCLKKLLESLPVAENADKKISTKGFFIFAGIMIEYHYAQTNPIKKRGLPL